MENRLPLVLQKIVKTFILEIVKNIPLQELQSLVGLFNFAFAVVQPGRTILRRLIDLTKGLRKPQHRCRLNREAKADLKACSLFIQNVNGKSLFLKDTYM